MKKNLSVILVLAVCGLFLNVQKSSSQDSAVDIGADFVSRYVWRGLNLGGSAAHLQPYIEYSPRNTGLTIGTWGSFGLSPGAGVTEADLYISYSPVESFTVTISDYFFPSDSPFARDDYFNYKKGETGHTLEGMVSFNGTENFPVSILFAMNLYGDDGTDEDGNNYYAKYLEIGYSTSYKNLDIETFAGMAIDNPKTELGAEGWYGDSGGIINLGVNFSGSLRISETISIPAFSSLIFNPEAGNIYLVAGLSFGFTQ